MLKQPLPEENDNSAHADMSSLQVAQMVMAAASMGATTKNPSAEFTPKKQGQSGGDDDGDNTTQAMNDASGDKSNTATAGHGGAEGAGEDEDVDRQGKKKRKKRANKR